MRVGIVNDLRMAAEVLRRIVVEMAGFEVAWVAVDGKDAVAQHRARPADIVLMDLILPGIDGAATTAQVMHVKACAVLVVTASVVDHRDLVFAAMSRGALDAVNTPAGVTAEASAELRRKLTTIGRLVKHAPVLTPHAQAGVEAPHFRPASKARLRIVAIGASTGGPQAVATLLRQLPKDFGASVLVLQHLDEQFVPGLQRWLQHECALPVKLVAGNELLTAGQVWLAHTEDHLVVRDTADGLRLGYTAEPLEALHRPSVDVLFESLVRLPASTCCGILLTGMGADGASGLLNLHRAGAVTMAQDEDSSVVYGMPRVALELGAVAGASTLDQIAKKMIEFGGRR